METILAIEKQIHQLWHYAPLFLLLAVGAVIVLRVLWCYKFGMGHK